MGLRGLVIGAIATAIGAVMYWAVAYQGAGFHFSTVGVILMTSGAFCFVVSAIDLALPRNPQNTNPSWDRQVVDARNDVEV
jgi:uncharacterized membrane protein YvlD (DUF360 family)